MDRLAVCSVFFTVLSSVSKVLLKHERGTSFFLVFATLETLHEQIIYTPSFPLKIHINMKNYKEFEINFVYEKLANTETLRSSLV